MNSFSNVADLPERYREQAKRKLGIDTLPKQSKYRNKKTLAGDRVFDSILEAKRYGELSLLEKAGQISALQLQIPFTLPGNITYYADFVYFDHLSKSFVIEDAKGVKTKEYTIKKKLMKELGLEITEIKK